MPFNNSGYDLDPRLTAAIRELMLNGGALTDAQIDAGAKTPAGVNSSGALVGADGSTVSGGGGSSSWSALTDKATANLPVENGPLAASLLKKGYAAALGAWHFFASLKNSMTPQTADSGVTSTFARNFNLSVRSTTTGIWSDVAHQTPGFTFVADAGVAMLAGSNAGTQLISDNVSHRDLTQTGWVKTGATATKNATGIDNVANAASSLTATADGATALFATTASASTRTLQAWVRRKTGKGRVWLTADAGASWADITSQIGRAGGVYARVSIPANGTNPSVGFQLEYNTDAIEVDCVAVVAKAYPVPPLMARGASAEGQTIQWASAKNAAAVGKSFELSFDMVFDDAADGGVSLFNPANAGHLLNVSTGIANSPTAQLIGPGGIIYNTIPRLTLAAAAQRAGVVNRYSATYAGGAIYMRCNGVLTSIYDTATLVAHDVDTLSTLQSTIGSGNAVGNVGIRPWRGRIISLLGDSISAVDAYTLAVLGEAGADSTVVLNKGVGGNTVANVRDRIAADLAYALPSTNECWVVLWVGTNSLANNVAPATALSELQTAINNILAINAAAKILAVSTITNRTGGLTGITAGQFTTNAIAYNAGIPALTGVSKYLELNGTDMGVDTSTAGFLSDGIHPFYRWYTPIARKIIAAIS